MLVKPKFKRSSVDSVLSAIASLGNRPTKLVELGTGLYQCGHWNFEEYLRVPSHELLTDDMVDPERDPTTNKIGE